MLDERERASFHNARSASVATNTGPYSGSRFPQHKWAPRNNTGATVSVMTVYTVAAGNRGNPTAARNHVAIDETTVSANCISEASNCVYAGARDTVVPDGPIVLRLAELNFLDINVAGDDHTLWRRLDDAG